MSISGIGGINYLYGDYVTGFQLGIEMTLTVQYEQGILQEQITKKFIDPNTLLHKAILEKNSIVLEFLLKHGVDVDYPDENGMSPLTVAILSQQSTIVKLLLEKGANPMPQKKWNGMSLLEISMTAKDVDSVQYLIEHGVDVNNCFKNGKSPVEFWGKDSLRGPKEFQIINLLIDSDKCNQIQLNTLFRNINCIYIDSPRFYDELCKKLIHKNVDINTGNGIALVNACKKSDMARINMLLENGANPNLHPPGELTPLMGSCASNTALMNLLLKYEANPNQIVKIKYPDGREEHSALTLAIYSLERTKILIEAGADIKLKTDNKTIVEHAFEAGQMDVVAYLITLQG